MPHSFHFKVSNLHHLAGGIYDFVGINWVELPSWRVMRVNVSSVGLTCINVHNVVDMGWVGLAHLGADWENLTCLPPLASTGLPHHNTTKSRAPMFNWVGMT